MIHGLKSAALLAILSNAVVQGGDPPWQPPPLRQQAELQQTWLKARLERVLPTLMRKHGVQMWLVICREYNEDPVFFSLTSPTTLSARRRTIYVFFDRGEQGVERLALGGGSNGGLYTVFRDTTDPGKEITTEGQWAALRKIVDERNPARIAVDVSTVHAFADGLTASEYELAKSALGPEWMKRVAPAELLAVDYMDVRLPEMLPVYRSMTEVVHWLIARAFSNEVIAPGKTTSQHVAWWLRQRTQELGYGTWFHPTVRVQKPGSPGVRMLDESAGVVIERGDVLHVDYGLSAMRLNTDTQHMGYVLREGETDPPAGIVAALRQAQRLQDIVLAELRPGRSGNEVLAASLAAMRKADINGSVYSHPIGDHGHGAGPLVGLWDRQQGVPGRGESPVLPDSWFSIELNIRTPVPEWGSKELFVGMEEDVSVDAQGRVGWILKRQEQFHLVK
jgi:hypothetical protein